MRSEGQLDGTNQSLSGVGIFSRGVGLISYAYVFSYIGVTWVDGRTFEIMKGPAVTFEGVMKHMADNFVSNELLQKVDKSMFPETAANSANNTALRDTTRDFSDQTAGQDSAAVFRAIRRVAYDDKSACRRIGIIRAAVADRRAGATGAKAGSGQARDQETGRRQAKRTG